MRAIRLCMLFGWLQLMNTSFGQHEELATLDSLNRVVQSTLDDSILVKSMLTMSTHRNILEEDSVLNIFREVVGISIRCLEDPAETRHIFFSTSVARSLHNLASYYSSTGQPEKAIELYLAALKFVEFSGNNYGLVIINNNIGTLNAQMGNRTAAIAQYKHALSLLEDTLDPLEAILIGNIGDQYKHRSDSAGKAGNTKLAESCMDTALSFVQRAIMLCQQRSVTDHLAVYQLAEAAIFQERKHIDEAIAMAYTALESAEIAGDPTWIARCHTRLGRMYLEMKEPRKALREAQLALQYLNEFSDINARQYNAELFSEAYTELNDSKFALDYLIVATSMRDSISNSAKRESVMREQFRYDSAKKTATDSMSFVQTQRLRDAKISEQQTKLDHERTANYILFASAGVFLLLGTLVYRGYRGKKRDHQMITAQKNEVDSHRQQILGSIGYAEKIQKSVLPDHDLIKRHLPGFSALYLPRDIVSGDFYWFAHRAGASYLALADCTGHGVPGAFMSLIGSTVLKDVVVDSGVSDPAVILTKLDQSVRELLKQQDENSSDDGMEIGLVKFEFDQNKLTFCGANLNLFVLEDSMQICKGTLRGIGGWVRKPERLPVFTSREFSLKKIRAIYLSSDGMEDQPGGTDGEKFGRDRLVSLFEQSPKEEISGELLSSITNWRAGLPQIDDVCVLGVSLATGD